MTLPGVAFTALAAAAARAVETSRADRLVEDPFAAAFVAAAPSPVPLPTRWPDDDATLTDQETLLLLGANYVGLRTRFFDDVLRDADQVVLLAAGLDTRAFRLAWPDGATVFELDRPDVLAFKTTVLAGHTARCALVGVPADLAGDWTTPLLDAGFDRTRPTTWIAEGLLQYLSPQAEHDLLTAVDGLSARGSTLAVERALDLGDPSRLREGSERAGIRVDRLVHGGPRADLATWLHDRGWTAGDHPVDHVAARYDRPLLHPRLTGDTPRPQPTPAGFTTATKG
ncbi:MAG: SAM-dependent methyltransferase [Saccharothrix sp.]|nr:SAM-dependent methyltransferase [Saccharothrix sp.]